jgi:hypothetical protein
MLRSLTRLAAPAMSDDPLTLIAVAAWNGLR